MGSKMLTKSFISNKTSDNKTTKWTQTNYRLFVGNLSKDVTDEILAQHFSHYPSFVKARVIRDKYTKGPKGYGFVSFLEASDYSKALTEMEWTHIFNRPCKLSKSTYKELYTENKDPKRIKNQSESSKLSEYKNSRTRPNDTNKKNRKYHIGGIPNFDYTDHDDI